MSSVKVQVRKKELPASTVRLEIRVPKEEWQRFELRVTSRLAQGLKLPGFRPGKAPLGLVKNRLEEDKIAQEVLEELLPLSYAEAVKQVNIKPIGSPKIKIVQFEKGKDFVFTAECAVWPEIKLADYRKIRVKKPSVKVNAKEIEREIELLKKRLVSTQSKQGTVKEGDRVLVDFQGWIKDKKIPSLKQSDLWLLVGEREPFPGFGKELVGKRKGEKVKFELVLPKDFVQQGLAGQKVKFEVEIKKVEKVVEPSLDEVAKKLGHKDEKELRQRIKDFLLQQKTQGAEKKWETEIVSRIAEKSQLEVSPQLIDQEQDRLLQQLNRDLAFQGLTLEQLLHKSKLDKGKLAEQLKKQAEANLRHSFVLHAIAEKENIRVKKDEVAKALKEEETRLRLQGYPENDIREYLESPEAKAQIRTQLKLNKVLAFLKTLHKEA